MKGLFLRWSLADSYLVARISYIVGGRAAPGIFGARRIIIVDGGQWTVDSGRDKFF